ncbi:hypothetical protein [Absidia glauca]|uniref:Uncharacterized protein n=1 Tax=Absidia glauca TaxID=4829 RepID=A0A168T422_ABSGL|nr:hypothetical protein [Absidia glauca]
MVQKLVEPGASFFDGIGSGFNGDVVLLGKVADDGDDRSALVKEILLFLVFAPFDTPLSLQSIIATSKPIMSSKAAHPLNLTPRLFQTLVHVRVSKMTGTYSKEYSDVSGPYFQLSLHSPMYTSIDVTTLVTVWMQNRSPDDDTCKMEDLVYDLLVQPQGQHYVTMAKTTVAFLGQDGSATGVDEVKDTFSSIFVNKAGDEEDMGGDNISGTSAMGGWIDNTVSQQASDGGTEDGPWLPRLLLNESHGWTL